MSIQAELVGNKDRECRQRREVVNYCTTRDERKAGLGDAVGMVDSMLTPTKEEAGPRGIKEEKSRQRIINQH